MRTAEQEVLEELLTFFMKDKPLVSLSVSITDKQRFELLVPKGHIGLLTLRKYQIFTRSPSHDSIPRHIKFRTYLEVESRQSLREHRISRNGPNILLSNIITRDTLLPLSTEAPQALECVLLTRRLGVCLLKDNVGICMSSQNNNSDRDCHVAGLGFKV
ncbi:hypothetical protein RF11_07366 [Thelohanellus kitauei]|uniref:Uncharacterized protein n=1 Tax=Thelohanellus kitauei TaxID=669202 RepID=A0A0C2M0U2_THEKT|nr:hypothetical protein RF11_07366 [Thelohanellus kitauei]